jgi:hypothetical protein
MAKANNMTPINNHRLRLTDIIRLTPVKRSPEENAPLQTFAVARGNTLTAAAKNLKDSTLKGCKGFPQLWRTQIKVLVPKQQLIQRRVGFYPSGFSAQLVLKSKRHSMRLRQGG